MDTKFMRALELDKVLDMLGRECSCEDAANTARSIEPETDLVKVRQMLSETSDAHMLLGRFGSPSFGGVRNITNAVRRAQAGAVLTIPELMRISEVLRIIRSLREWRGHCEGVITCIDPLFMGLVPYKSIEDNINTAILNEDELSDNASADLASIRRKIRSAQSRVREKLDALVRSSTHSKYLQDAIVTQRGGRFVVPVKAEFRGEIAGLVHDTSSSGATLFVEPMAVVEANNEIRVLQTEERAEIERILAALSSQAGDCADGIITSYNMLMELDLLFAKARLAYNMKASLPNVNEDGIIDLKKARHPLINRDKVVPTNIRLGRDFDTLVITGPNTGGKTVALKTLGLLSAMAMCGLMLPVSDESEISTFENILADIGDEQSIEQSLSTFSAHMTNIIRFFKIADSRTLVLLDELGAGTDPVEGAALATSIIEHLRMQGCTIAATTHYAEIKAFAISTPGVENGCCEFDVKTLRPTYRLLIGMPGRSNAFAISEKLGIPIEVVNRAKELISEDDARFERVVEDLEKSRQSMESEQEKAQKLRIEAQRVRDDAAKSQQRLEKERQDILELAKAEASRIVSSARAQSEALIQEIDQFRKELKNHADAASLSVKAKQELRSRIKGLEDTADPIVTFENDEEYVLPRPLRAGDSVLIVTLEKKATVSKEPDSSGNVEVQAGALKMRVKLSDLRLLAPDKKAEKAKQKDYSVTKKLSRDATSEIDVRGQSVDEAVLEVDSAIDSAAVMNLGEIRIIHGKGTGALRAGLHQHFRRHPHVKSFRLGTFGEGEAGVTIITLK